MFKLNVSYWVILFLIKVNDFIFKFKVQFNAKNCDIVYIFTS